MISTSQVLLAVLFVGSLASYAWATRKDSHKPQGDNRGMKVIRTYQIDKAFNAPKEAL